jgi:acyl carrier protein
MKLTQEVLDLLDEVLRLQGRAQTFQADTPLMGAVAELDSLAVMELLSALQQRFGLQLHDDELDSSLFATVGSLVAFVSVKLRRVVPAV